MNRIIEALQRAKECLNADSDRMINAGIWDEDDDYAHTVTHRLIDEALDKLGQKDRNYEAYIEENKND